MKRKERRKSQGHQKKHIKRRTKREAEDRKIQKEQWDGIWEGGEGKRKKKWKAIWHVERQKLAKKRKGYVAFDYQKLASGEYKGEVRKQRRQKKDRRNLLFQYVRVRFVPCCEI